MGWIYRRKDGLWVAPTQVDSPAGPYFTPWSTARCNTP